MFKEERMDAIMELLKEQKFMTVEALVERLHYSPATIRRDLIYLERIGLVKKSYGGVSLRTDVRPQIIREHENTAEKIHICRAAAELIREGDTVFVDATTTTFFLGEALTHIRGITVVTTNIKLALYLGEHGVRCYVAGGRLYDSTMLGDTEAAELLSHMRFDIAFFSVGYASEEGDITVSTHFRAAFDAVLLRTRRAVCLCDKHKLSTASHIFYRNIGIFDDLFMDGQIPEGWADAFPQTKLHSVS